MAVVSALWKIGLEHGMALKQTLTMPMPIGIHSSQLLARAREFRNAYERLAYPDRPDYSSAFLLAHATELLLKAYLGARGVPKKQLINMRHDLRKAFDLAEERYLPAVADLRLMCYQLSEMNKDNDFRYPTEFNHTVPRKSDSLAVLDRLVETISPIVNAARTSAELRIHSEACRLGIQKVRLSG